MNICTNLARAVAGKSLQFVVVGAFLALLSACGMGDNESSEEDSSQPAGDHALSDADTKPPQNNAEDQRKIAYWKFTAKGSSYARGDPSIRTSMDIAVAVIASAEDMPLFAVINRLSDNELAGCNKLDANKLELKHIDLQQWGDTAPNPLPLPKYRQTHELHADLEKTSVLKSTAEEKLSHLIVFHLFSTEDLLTGPTPYRRFMYNFSYYISVEGTTRDSFSLDMSQGESLAGKLLTTEDDRMKYFPKNCLQELNVWPLPSQELAVEEDLVTILPE